MGQILVFGFYDFLLIRWKEKFFCKNSIVVRLFQKNRFFGQSIKWKECRTRNAKEMERTNESGMGKAYCILIPL